MTNLYELYEFLLCKSYKNVQLLEKACWSPSSKPNQKQKIQIQTN